MRTDQLEDVNDFNLKNKISWSTFLKSDEKTVCVQDGPTSGLDNLILYELEWNEKESEEIHIKFLE